MIKVLLLEDNTADARLVQLDLEGVEGTSFEITHAKRLEEALERAGEQAFDIILSDLNLPDSKGFETFAKISETVKDIPIILLTGFNDEAVAMNIVKEGAEDYIVKGEVKGKYLARAIQYAIERQGLRKKLQEQNEQLEKMLRVDPLTGLFSRRHILSCANDEVARHNRYGSPLSIIHLDVDDFKHINDDYGHNAGDQALKDVADYIRENIREVDKAARYGGDEFLILLPDSDVRAAEAVCEKLHSREIVSTIAPDLTISLSLSIGAVSAEEETTATRLIDTADFAMLTAKKSGKGRYFVATECIDKDVEEDSVDQLKETRNTLREVICQFIGAALSEMERQQDVSDTAADIMQMIADKLPESSALTKEQRRTLYNVIQIIRFQDLGIAVEMVDTVDSLTEVQRNVLRDRFNYNISLIRNIRFLQEESELLSNVHEHYDGTGFPAGKQGEEIPYLSRILSILYDYAREMKKIAGITQVCTEEVIQFLEQRKGKQYDPELTDLIVLKIRELAEQYQSAFSGDVLLVEDDRINVRLLEKYLSKAGYTISAADTLQEGRAKLAEKPWKVIFLDLMLPDGDGRDMLPEIKQLPEKPTIVITSSCFDKETIESIKESGADIYAIKPIKLRLLLKLLAARNVHPGSSDEMQVVSGLTSITELR